jgi:hypothetical protein
VLPALHACFSAILVWHAVCIMLLLHASVGDFCMHCWHTPHTKHAWSSICACSVDCGFCDSHLACCLHLLLVFADSYSLSCPAQHIKGACIDTLLLMLAEQQRTKAATSCATMLAAILAMQIYAETLSLQLLLATRCLVSCD